MGLRLSGGTARLVLQGDVLQLQQLSFQTGRNGTLTASGTVRLDGQQGVAVDLAVASRRALLVNRADLVATVSSDLKVTGSTGAGIDVAGPVTVDRAEISVGGVQSAAFPTVDVREINKPGASPAPPPSPARAAPPSPSATPIRLALNVQAPQAVFVRGRGLDAEMSGSLQVTGAPTAPAVIGGLTVRRGDFTLGGRRLVFSRGIVSLNNVDRIDPALDFIATTTVQSTTINVVISGTAAAPVIAISSVPALPQDEALALLLFGKPASGLSAFELIQVAQTLAELTGREAPGTGVLGRLRQSLGLDQLRVGTSSGSSSSSSSSPVSVEAGRYVAPGVYVGAKQGATGNSSRGVVEIDVLDHTKLEGDIGADSNGRVGVKMQWDY
jgi:translocation and assembly module TamB